MLKRKDEPKDLQVAEKRDGTIAREELEEEDLKVETPFPLSACQVIKASFSEYLRISICLEVK